MQSYEVFVWGPWYLQQGVYALSNATFILPLLLSQNQQLPYTGFVIVKYTFCHTSRGREDNTGYFTFISERQIYTSTQLPLKLLLLLLLLSTETITSIQTIRNWDHKDKVLIYYGQGAQVRQFNFHTAPELCKVTSSMLLLYDNRDSKCYCY